MGLKKFPIGIFVVGSFAVGTCISKLLKQDEPTSLHVKMPSLYSRSISDLDPRNITNFYQNELVQNLYGRLVTTDSENQLVVDVPDSFEVKDDEVIFTFGQKSKTIEGHIITAQDAAVSLNRIVTNGKSGHSDLKQLICPNLKLKSVCSGISAEGNLLKIKVVDRRYLSFLLPALDNPDYSIIPLSVIDPQSGAFADRRHRNTSGPYYVDGVSNEGHILFRANPGHYLFDLQMPQTIEIVPALNKSSTEIFENQDYNVIPFSYPVSGEAGHRAIQSGQFKVHKTLPLRVVLVAFSMNAMKKYTPQQRMYAGLKIGRAFTKHASGVASHSTHKFFQALSDGAFSDEEKRQIEEVRSINSKPRFSSPIVLGATQKQFPYMSLELANEKEIEVVQMETPPLLLERKDRPDAYLVATDSAWNEDLSLLRYNFESGTFSLPGVNSEKWIAEYISTPDKKDRIRKLSRLHFDLLKYASFVPFLVSPYISMSREELELNQSTISGRTELWRIRRK